MGNLTVRPINTGFLGIPKTSLFHSSLFEIYKPPELQEKTPVFCFLIEGGDRPMLIDSGMASTEWGRRQHYPTAEQPEGMSVVEQLKKLGYAPRDIGYVVLTHLHWDHCFYLPYFTEARFFVHPRELAFAKDPIPTYYRAYEHPILGIKSPYGELSLETVSEGTEIIPGVSVLETPGHSPGHISLCVKAASGEYICAGDAVMTLDNLKEVPALHYPISPPGLAIDLIGSWHSITKLKNRMESAERLLCSHDMRLPARIVAEPVLR